jgi:hypothetical protein
MTDLSKNTYVSNTKKNIKIMNIDDLSNYMHIYEKVKE